MDHFIYGSQEGYRIKAMSGGVDPESCSEALMGFFVPISQSDARHLRDVRLIVPLGEDSIMVSHLLQGVKDEYLRNTLANHTAIVPRSALAKGDLTYWDVDRAMSGFELEHPDASGELGKLEVDPQRTGPSLQDLPTLLGRQEMEKVLDYFKRDRDDRVFLFYKGSDPQQRIALAFLMSMLIDVTMNVVRLSVFSDVPYADAKRLFNLVIARSMIGIKPGQGWSVVPATVPASAPVLRRLGKDPIGRIYGEDGGS